MKSQGVVIRQRELVRLHPARPGFAAAGFSLPKGGLHEPRDIPIESTFATVQLRTTKTKGCLSRKTALAMVFKLLLSALRKWCTLDGSSHLVEVIQGGDVQGRDQENQTRRLIKPSPTFGHSSNYWRLRTLGRACH